MERWLSKPRVMVALSAVMLMAALNRSDPLVYGLFLFLATLSALGWLLPWAALRGVAVRAAGSGEVSEGAETGLSLLVEQRGWWPVFMLEVETHWQWAGHRIVLRHVVPVLRPRRARDLGRKIRFPCRGRYRLERIALASGFPLGLQRARRDASVGDVSFLVLPALGSVDLPGDLDASADDLGLQTTRRLGHSSELAALREYEPGDPLGRVHWRASARAGHLVIQQHLQSGSPLVHVVTQLPDAAQAGDPQAPAEEAIRAAATLCQRLADAGVRVRAHLPGNAEPLARPAAIRRALAAAEPGGGSLADAIARAAAVMRRDERFVAVVGADVDAGALLRLLAPVRTGGGTAIVCIAVGAGETSIASAAAAFERGGCAVVLARR
jgi:uncharacterized protein (DUF58 family)